MDHSFLGERELPLRPLESLLGKLEDPLLGVLQPPIGHPEPPLLEEAQPKIDCRCRRHGFGLGFVFLQLSLLWSFRRSFQLDSCSLAIQGICLGDRRIGIWWQAFWLVDDLQNTSRQRKQQSWNTIMFMNTLQISVT